MKNTKKTVLMSLSALTLLSQTACVMGVMTGLGPTQYSRDAQGLFVLGQISLVGGLAAFITGNPALGVLLEGAAFVLDEKNPGRIDALNPMPLDASVATSMGVSVSDLEVYNDELASVHELNTFIEGRIKSFQQDHVFLDSDAKTLGFDDAQSLLTAFQGNDLSKNDVARMARASGLSESTTLIYLAKRFQVSVAR